VKKETIKINVPSDMIEQHLLNVVNGHPNAHTLVESIIGVGVLSGKLGHMFMGSLGVLPTQHCGIGEEVRCIDTVYDYFGNEGADRPQYREIGNCRVVEFKPYYDEQYVVEYTSVNKDGSTCTQTASVNANTLSALPLDPPTEIYGVL
jgi:hypothetical protein